MAKATLKAVPPVPVVEADLSEFRRTDQGIELWRGILAKLGIADEAKLRGALNATDIGTGAIVGWLRRRGINVHHATVTRWRREEYATTE